ncbi:S16 family serine protease [Actinoplanes sp. NPDC026670]|uniref:S16 family serine protease n=1 Tax=Actinoplanes sp. NPDC026670 TaxID=3154700 RepID=UPI00340F9A21
MVLRAGALATVLLAAGAWFAPMPYLVEKPGPAIDVLGPDVIAVTGADVSTSTGRLLLTTVEVVDVDGVGGAARAWFDDRAALVPREAVFPAGQSDEQAQRANEALFAESESTAITVALTSLGQPAGVRVSIGLRDIGGPSAGLMIMLGIVDKLTPADLTGGRVIAGTGALRADGTVGPIGGIPQKLHGARAAGAEYFLVPEGNCAEAARNPVPGLTLARVATADDALLALKTITAGGTPTAC